MSPDVSHYEGPAAVWQVEFEGGRKRLGYFNDIELLCVRGTNFHLTGQPTCSVFCSDWQNSETFVLKPISASF